MEDNLSHIFYKLSSLRSPVVITHSNPDHDAVASASIVNYINNAKVVLPGEVKAELIPFIRYLGISYLTSEKLEGKDVVIVDTSSKDMLAGADLSKAKSVTIIDHHDSEPDIEGEHIIIPHAGSTTEILVNAVYDAGHRLTERLITASTYAIYKDTAKFRVCSSLSYKALYRMGSPQITSVEKALGIKRDVSSLIALIKDLRDARMYVVGDISMILVFSDTSQSFIANTLSEAGFDIVIVSGEYHNTFRASIRSSIFTEDYGLSAIDIAEKLSKKGYKCGGHRHASGCIGMDERYREVLEEVINDVIKYYSKATGSPVREY